MPFISTENHPVTPTSTCINTREFIDHLDFLCAKEKYNEFLDHYKSLRTLSAAFRQTYTPYRSDDLSHEAWEILETLPYEIHRTAGLIYRFPDKSVFVIAFRYCTAESNVGERGMNDSTISWKPPEANYYDRDWVVPDDVS